MCFSRAARLPFPRVRLVCVVCVVCLAGNGKASLMTIHSLGVLARNIITP
jgi:hypothetical protein